MKVAIFGMGSIGRRHVTNLLEMGEHDVLICDPADVQPMPGLYSLTRDENAAWDWTPEAVLICTPPSSHHALALRALSQRIHVFCEKPLAVDSVRAVELAEIAIGSGVQLAVGYQLAWQLGGIPVGEDLTWDCRQDMSGWPSRYEKDVLLEFSHEIHAAVHINGPVEAVTARTGSWGWELALRHIRSVSRITIVPHAIDEYARSCYSTLGEVWEFDSAANDDAYKAELKTFLSVCQGQPWDDRLCTGMQAAHVLKIVEAARESARECKVVAL